MDTLLGYIKNIGFFLILVSVICNTLPENSYKKYCKLFCGLVLVVLVITPFCEMLNYDGDISDIFMNKSYQSDLLELEASLKMQEEEQMQLALDRYEEELKNTLQNVAASEGLCILDVNVNYTQDGEELVLEGVDIYTTESLSSKKNSINNGSGDEENNFQSDDIILDEIHIDDIEIDSYEGGDNGNDIDKLSPGDRPKALKMMEKVAEMLGIETYMISVTIK